jgi:Xaa-Pro aminopeptidase
MTRTVALGEPSPEMRKVYSTVLRAQTMCEAALAAGKNCFEIDRLARDYIDSQGYAGRFGHGLGHCVGIDIHENPRLSPSCHDTLKAGMVITVEPGIYLPGIGGVRIENTCLVKENGSEPLTTARKELVIL